MIVNGNKSGGGVDYASPPQISFDGKWSGWHIEVYNGTPYWEALFATSGTLVSLAQYTADLWGIGGGGAGDSFYQSGHNYGNGGGSGYTNMVENVTISAGGHAVSIGAGSTALGSQGGSTKFLDLTCKGGYGGSSSGKNGGNGGSNGATSGKTGGENGSPGDGKIMSKFWSTEHNTEYGAGGKPGEDDNNGGGGGGYLDVGAPTSTSGHGYGGGGGGGDNPTDGYQSQMYYDWQGKSGCLVARIKAA